MGGHDQSQVKIKFKKFEKSKSVPKTYQKVITMTSFFLYLVARCFHTSWAVGGSVETVVVPVVVVEMRYSSMWSWSSLVQVDPIRPRALELAFFQTLMAAILSLVGALMFLGVGYASVPSRYSQTSTIIATFFIARDQQA